VRMCVCVCVCVCMSACMRVQHIALLVKEFCGARYQSGFLFLKQCGEWFSLPA
jgi:hypothetical protein